MEAANQTGVVVPFIWAMIAFGMGVVGVIAAMVQAAKGGPKKPHVASDHSDKEG